MTINFNYLLIKKYKFISILNKNHEKNDQYISADAFDFF